MTGVPNMRRLTIGSLALIFVLVAAGTAARTQRARHDQQVTTNHYLCWSPAIAYGHAISGDP